MLLAINDYLPIYDLYQQFVYHIDIQLLYFE